MKIKRILSLFCSAALVATALSTGAIITKADEQQSEPIKVDFSTYNQVDYDGKNGDKANMNYTPWGIKTCAIKTDENGNNYFNFTKENKASNGAYSTTFLVDPNGEHGKTCLESYTTYNITVRYKFNKLEIPENEDDTKPDKLCPYIGFKSTAEYITQPDDSGAVNPVSGLWTKYGYYVNVMNPNGTNTKAIKGGIGMGSMETANGADVWKTFETRDGWTTGTLSFTTNDVKLKDMYFGFTTGCYGITCVATIDYDIDYIEIAKASADDPDAYAKNANTYLDFSVYKYESDKNIGKHVTIADNISGVNGKVAHIKAEKEAEQYSTNFRVSLTNQNYPMGKLLTPGKTYQLEIRYKYNSCSTELGALISFSNSFWCDFLSKQLFGSEGNKISENNPTGNFWDEAVIDNNGWVTARLNFNAPNNIDNNYMYFMFADSETGLAKGTSIDMYIEYINVRLAAPVKIDGEEVAFGVPGDSMAALAKDEKKENYETESSKATATKTTYYYNQECTNKVDFATAKYGAENVLYSKDETVVDTESQAAFCGFDEYKLRPHKDEFGKKEDWTFYEGAKGAAGFSSYSFSITSADSYTGTKSLLYNYKDGDVRDPNQYDAYQKVAYIGNGYDLIPGKTYELSFWYKPAANNSADKATFMFTSGSTWLSWEQSSIAAQQEVSGLNDQKDWKQVKLLWECTIQKNGNPFADKKKELSWCAPVLKLQTTDKKTAIYFDSFVISEVATYDGAAKLNKVDTDGKQAIRFKYSYDTVASENNKVKIAGETYTVAERGILVKSANNSANLVRNTTANGVMKAVKTDKFDECWNYNDETGKYEFSMYIKGLAEKDSRELVSRAYVVLKDADNKETVFYSETSTTSVERINEIIKSKTTVE